MTPARAPRPGGGIRVSVTQDGRPVRAAAGLGLWLASAAPSRARGDVAIALVTDRRMRALNRTFRGVDHATDVLSFPAGMEQPGVSPAGLRGPEGPRLRRKSDPGPRTSDLGPSLGDVAIALSVARRQAREQRHSLATELRVLSLHGLLHLLGYDHERDNGAMRAVEDRLRRRAGLPVGLITRAGRRTLQA